MDDAEGGGGAEHGPVGGATEPFEVFAQELVGRRAGVGEGVHEGHGRVEDRVSGFEGVLLDHIETSSATNFKYLT